MKCTNCGSENTVGTKNCVSCNRELEVASAATPIAPPSQEAATTKPIGSTPNYPQAASQQTPPSAAPHHPTPPNPSVAPQAPTQPPYHRMAQNYPYQQPYNQPYIYSPAQKGKQAFSIIDAYIIIGFVLAVIGVFTFSFILLPASIGFSVVGFLKRTNSRTHGLSIAGIVVGVVAILIRVGSVLHDFALIPAWLSAGIFG